jgi:hypothetical protein
VAITGAMECVLSEPIVWNNRFLSFDSVIMSASAMVNLPVLNNNLTTGIILPPYDLDLFNYRTPFLGTSESHK